jgi:predicted DNA-binding ribbon-helix-helix protein
MEIVRKSGPEKRSVLIKGHRTSVSLEPDFWDELQHQAKKRALSINMLIGEIDAARETNLSSALRLYVLEMLKAESGRPTQKSDD